MNLLSLSQWPPALHGVALALSTFAQEDATTIAAALLSSAGKLDGRVAFIACFGGIWIGDALLYWLARGAGRPLLATRMARRLISEEAVTRGEAWFRQRGPWAIVLSRFVPGMRLPTYLAAGFLRVSFPQFLAITAAAVLVWTAGLFFAARWAGDRAPSLAQGAGSFVALGLVTLLTLSTLKRTNARALFRRGAVWCARWAHWEFWPAWLFYSPVALNYLRLALRYRGFTLPTAANPGIFSGGFVGESKLATLRELHTTSPEFTAEAHSIEGATAEARLDSLAALRARHGIGYPLILKPDIGQRGVGVRLIRTAEQAEQYLRTTAGPLVLQRYAPGPFEVGVFYYRFPGESRGRIFAVTEKIFPVITGDGRHSVEELIWNDARARFLAGKYLSRLDQRRREVLAPGQTLKLVEAGNHAQGCIFRDGARLWSEALERRVDEISQRLDGFFIGRYDIRFAEEADLRAGRNFHIIELNGAASEATNIYDARNSLFSAYRTLFRQWELVFAVGAANRRRGSSPTSLASLWRAWRETRALTQSYPLAD